MSLQAVPANLDQAWAGLRDLQHACHENAKSKGFHDDAVRLGRALKSVEALGLDETDDIRQVLETAVRDRTGNRLMLIVGELAEAHEELRAGRLPAEEYVSYPQSLVDEIGVDAAAQQFADRGLTPKPEGLPSELADVLIRLLEFAEEHKIDLGDVARRKFRYNAEREMFHGGKRF